MRETRPEWGPSHLRSEQDSRAAVQAAMDLRDNGGERPDDN